MTPSQARAFRAVAAEGSFTAAAKALGVSQPTVTNQVRLIEARYKVELFHRGHGGVRLTAVGADLLTHVRRMFDNYDNAVLFLREAQGVRQGHLCIGSYAPYGLIPMMAQFRAQYPGISIKTAFANSRSLVARLQQYDLDVAIMASIDHHSEFHAFRFGSLPLIMIAPRTAQWKHHRSISRDEILKENLVRRESGSSVRAAFDELVGTAPLDADKVIEIESRDGVVNAVAEGLGVAAIFDEGLLPEDRIVKLKIRGIDIRSKVDVVCLAERRANPIIRAFLAIAKGMSKGTR
jgi:aminoethylphosphonate catabolism LysR family transcriptional regulator